MVGPIRVRIAPSPTGMPHVGLFHTFLYNWLYARHTGGQFVLRIEDTDRARLVEGAVESLMEAIGWLGLDWDEGPLVGGPFAPYVQSERVPLYREHAEQLVSAGHAYYCYCSPERLAALREQQEKVKLPPGYDRHCRDLDEAERRAAAAAAGDSVVIRFAVPLEGETTFHDLLRGDITWENRLLDDFVILKSDGFPTYHLAHLVDDHLMEVTDVMRGDEWISSTPRHVLLYQAFGWPAPRFCHLAPLLGPDGKKLSKRHGATAVLDYRDEGYLPEALVNYLAIVGTSYDPEGKREIFSLAELVDAFSLERINKSGAVFDLRKLEWMNGYYIRQLDRADLARRLLPFLQAAGCMDESRLDYLEQLVPLVQERLQRLTDAPDLLRFACEDRVDYEPKNLIGKGLTAESSRHALQAALELLGSTDDFEDEPLEAAMRQLADEIGVKSGQLFMVLRWAITGTNVSPPLFASMVAIGRERTVERVADAVRRLDTLIEERGR